MKELSIEKLEMVSGVGCGMGDYIGMVAGVGSIALLISFPPAGTALALASGTLTGLGTGASLSCLFF